MEYQDNKLIDFDSEKYLFSESDRNKTLDDMIIDSYLLHPTNVIFNLNCYQIDSKPTVESEFVNINLNETKRDQSLQASQTSSVNSQESKCKYSDQKSEQDKKTSQNNGGRNLKDEKCINLNRIKTSKNFERMTEGFKSLKDSNNQLSELNQKNYEETFPNQVALTQNKACSKKYGSSRVPKFKRWGVKEDIEMFKLLRKELKVNKIDEEKFISVNIDAALDHNSQDIKNLLYRNLIAKIVDDTNWARTPYHLFHRILKLGSNQEFSFRNEKLIRALLFKRFKGKKVSSRKIVEFFPGKLVRSIENKIRDINAPKIKTQYSIPNKYFE